MPTLGKSKKRVALIYCPDYLVNSDLFFPPYALSVYRRQLRDAGYDVKVIDLSFVILQRPEWRELHDEICDLELNSSLNRTVARYSDELFASFCSESHVSALIDAFIKEIGNAEADYHCFSMMHAPLMYGLAIISAVKKRFGKPTIVGGRSVDLPESYIGSLFRICPEVDYLFCMPRSGSLLKLLNALGDSPHSPLPPIPGLALMDDGMLVYHESCRREFRGMPEWLHHKPAFDIPDLVSYEYGKAEMRRMLVDQQIRWDLLPQLNSKIRVIADQFFSGCNHSCIFCPSSVEPISDFRSPKAMARRMVELYDEYGINYFYLLNSNINPSRKYVDEFCDELLRHGRPVYFSDSASFSNIDRGLMDKMKAAGCVLLWWGSEMVSERMLKYVGKDLTVKEIVDGVKVSHDAGIFNCLNFIIGMPYETDDDISETEEFLLENAKYIDAVQLNNFDFRGGLIERCPERYGIRMFRDEDGMKVYDELDGLKWPERKKRSLEHMARLRDVINLKINRFSSPPMNIFYLHALAGADKGRMKEIIRQILPCDPDKVPC